jgi:hypothetical protein
MGAEDSTEELTAVLPARAEWEAFAVEAASMVEEPVMLEAVLIVAAEAAVTTEH